jgi:hypothetical protein
MPATSVLVRAPVGQTPVQPVFVNRQFRGPAGFTGTPFAVEVGVNTFSLRVGAALTAERVVDCPPGATPANPFVIALAPIALGMVAAAPVAAPPVPMAAPALAAASPVGTGATPRPRRKTAKKKPGKKAARKKIAKPKAAKRKAPKKAPKPKAARRKAPRKKLPKRKVARKAARRKRK